MCQHAKAMPRPIDFVEIGQEHRPDGWPHRGLAIISAVCASPGSTISRPTGAPKSLAARAWRRIVAVVVRQGEL